MNFFTPKITRAESAKAALCLSLVLGGAFVAWAAGNDKNPSPAPSRAKKAVLAKSRAKTMGNKSAAKRTPAKNTLVKTAASPVGELPLASPAGVNKPQILSGSHFVPIVPTSGTTNQASANKAAKTSVPLSPATKKIASVPKPHRRSVKPVTTTANPVKSGAKIKPLVAAKPAASSPVASIASRPLKTRAASQAAQRKSVRAASPAAGRSTKSIVQAVTSPVAPVFKRIPPYQKTMPPGSYLVNPARVDAAAYQQAITRPMILQRYQYAWKTSRAETLRRLQGLRLTKLTEAGVYRVYYARPNGAWGYKVRSVPVGTWVFTLPNTPRPLMLQVCGNPVEEVLPPRNAKQKGMIPPFSPQESDTGLVLEDLGDTGDLYAFTPQTPDFLGSGETLSGNSGNLINIPPVVADTLDKNGGILFPLASGLPVGALAAGGLLPIVGSAIGSQISNLGGNGGGSTNSGGNNINGQSNTGNTGGNNINGQANTGNTGGNNHIDVVPEPSGGTFGFAVVAVLGAAVVWPALRRKSA